LDKEHIQLTISLAHYYNSAFDRDQLYNYLQVKIERKEFELLLDQLIDQQFISEYKGYLFQNNLQNQHERQQQWSRQIFNKYRIYLKLIAIFPWIKFLGLTGANAFESCNKDDDLDIFIICKQNRLWICYSYIVLISILFRKRRILCVNYLVDENNLQLQKNTYYTAVQLVQMAPVYNKSLKNDMIRANRWLAGYLPNFKFDFGSQLSVHPDENKKRDKNIFPDFMKKLNKFILDKYYKRICGKFPEYVGKSMILKEGVAKLHHVDHHDNYDDINSAGSELIQNKKAV
jgi:hypothetical protein